MEDELLERDAVVYQERIEEIGRTLVSYPSKTDGKYAKKGDERIIVVWDADFKGDLKRLSAKGSSVKVYVTSEEDGQAAEAE